MNERIVLIEAGSAVFTRGLVADLVPRPIKSDLVLMDVESPAVTRNGTPQQFQLS